MKIDSASYAHRACRHASTDVVARDAQPGPRARPGPSFLHAPSFAFQAPGGGENQLIQTGMHLEAIGVPVRLFSPWTDRLETARVLHLFGMSREGLELARWPRRVEFRSCSRRSAGMSPAPWPHSNRARSKAGEPGGLGLAVPGPGGAELAARAASCGPTWSCPIRARRRISSFVSSGSTSERIRVVPNGVLPSVASATPELFHSRWGTEPFVLFVGRIEPRKNTLGLIQALEGWACRWW